MTSVVKWIGSFAWLAWTIYEWLLKKPHGKKNAPSAHAISAFTSFA